ncbi:MAG: hypothetical protein H8K07_01455 [Nitrospira sp.]|nr:hypothetical protein [Nitrospira sp.]
MRRLINAVLCSGLLFVGATFAADEQVVQQFSANGSRTTRPFTVQDGWEVRWTAEKSIGLFAVNGKGEAVAEIGSSSAGMGSSYQAKGGTFSIQIMSAGKWTIAVVQLP